MALWQRGDRACSRPCGENEATPMLWHDRPAPVSMCMCACAFLGTVALCLECCIVVFLLLHAPSCAHAMLDGTLPCVLEFGLPCLQSVVSGQRAVSFGYALPFWPEPWREQQMANGTMTRVVTGSCGNLQLCAFYFVFHSCLSSGDYRRCTKASRLLELHQCPVTMGGPQTLLNYMHIVHGL